MRLTKDFLLRFTKNYLSTRLQEKPRPVCIYLTGSLCENDFLLGNTTDVDLVCIYNLRPEKEREILPLAPDSHLDIWNYEITLFEQPRQLRSNAWIGSFLCENPQVLFDNGHWFQYTQASVAAQFFKPDNALVRAQPFIDAARQRWMANLASTNRDTVEVVSSLLNSLQDAANGFACLTAVPLSERRLIPQFASLAIKNSKLELTEQCNSIISPADWNQAKWPEWKTNWEKALKAVDAKPDCPVHLSGHRHSYYVQAAGEYWEKMPAAALWIMLKTWTDAVSALPEDTESRQEWNDMTSDIQMNAEHLDQRLEQLDRFLDSIEIAADQFKRKYSLDTESFS